MGNCLGKGKKSGQVLGTSEQSSNRPQYEAAEAQAPRRTRDPAQNPEQGRPVGGQVGAQDPRTAAAQAAEVSPNSYLPLIS